MKNREMHLKVFVKSKDHKFEPFYINYIDELLNEAKLKKKSGKLLSPACQDETNKIQGKSNSTRYLIEFASSSTIHGLKHLIAPGRHIFEKLLAAFSIAVSLVAISILSLQFWHRYQTEPTVIVLDHEYRYFNITRPGYIICPGKRIDDKKFPQVFQKYNITDSEDTREFFRFISQASYENFDKAPDNVPIIEPATWIYVLYDLKPSVDRSFHDTGGKLDSVWIVTEKGICLTMRNYVAPYSTLEYWKSNNWTIIPEPEVTKRSTYTYATRDIYDSFKIAFPDVLEITPIYPRDVLSPHNKFCQAKRLSMLTVRMSVTEVTTSQQVRELSVTQRKCKYSEENNLKMWPIYTHTMCGVECRYRQIYEFCNCHPHFARPMPDIPTCNVDQLKCIAKNLKSILLSVSDTAKKCGCYVDCDKARYKEELSTIYELKEGSQPEALINMIIDYPRDKYKRELLFGFADFLGAVGGGAGLLLGASVISFIEIFYFATLRLFWYIRQISKSKKKNKKNKTLKLVASNQMKRY